MIRKIVPFLIIFFSVGFLFAKGIEVTSYVDNTKIGIEDLLQYTIEVSGEDLDNVKMPNLERDIKDFELMGSSTSSSSSITIINGRMQSKITKTYVYSLKPQRTGKFIIPPLAVKYKGKKYFTKPISITVVKGSTQPSPPTSRYFSQSQNPFSSSPFSSNPFGFPSHNNRRSQPPANASEKLSDNIFIKPEISNTNIYIGQPITVTYKLYNRYDLSGMSFGSDPNFNGMWKEEVYRAKNVSFHREDFNGKLYNVMKLVSFAAFPTQTGKLVISPLEMKVDIGVQPSSFFDFGTTKTYTIKSNPITINVKDLPENGKPKSFNGAVGKFKINTSISSNKLKVGDSFTFTITISGKGNLNQFDAPHLPELNNFRVMDPETKEVYNNDKVSGKKIVKYLVIAQEKGNYEIPSIEFSYFDPWQKKYVVKKTAAYPITVSEGNNVSIPIYSGKINIKSEGNDIEFIITNAKMKSYKPLFDVWYYWLIWVITFLFIPAAIIFRKESDKLSSDIGYYRQKYAEKVIKKYLKEAQEYASNGKIEFYTAVQTGISNYIADKLGIPRGSTTDEIIQKLNDKKIDSSLIDEVRALYEKCNKARFMPGGFSQENIKEDFQNLKKIIGKLTKKL